MPRRPSVMQSEFRRLILGSFALVSWLSLIFSPWLSDMPRAVIGLLGVLLLPALVRFIWRGRLR